jgi:hypothetical protein
MILQLFILFEPIFFPVSGELGIFGVGSLYSVWKAIGTTSHFNEVLDSGNSDI